MKKTLFLLFLLWTSPCLAALPSLSLPTSVEVYGNGLSSVAFVVKTAGVSQEQEAGLRYFLDGQPEKNPASFDAVSKLFYWRPEPAQVGPQTFTLRVKDPRGREVAKPIMVKVLKAASLEALPKGWADLKKEAKYLLGRAYLPATNFIQVEIAAQPYYEIEIKVIDAEGANWTLTYVSADGKTKLDKAQGRATIMLGGEYAKEGLKKVRRDLYEDLYTFLGAVFRRIESIKLKGQYHLADFKIWDTAALISAVGRDNIYLPAPNIFFDDKPYREELYSAKDPMLISDLPVIKMELETTSGLIWQRGRLTINENSYQAAKGDFSLVVVKPHKEAATFDVNYAMYLLKLKEDKKLPYGELHLSFEFENAYEMLVSQEVFVRVVSLPVAIEGRPMVYPNPFRPRQDSEVSVQYKLTMPANIEVIIFGLDGSIKTRKSFSVGEEGGRKGYNKVTWDGKTPEGALAPNGIYSGVIVDRGENRILDKFKVTIFQ